MTASAHRRGEGEGRGLDRALLDGEHAASSIQVGDITAGQHVPGGLLDPFGDRTQFRGHGPEPAARGQRDHLVVHVCRHPERDQRRQPVDFRKRPQANHLPPLRHQRVEGGLLEHVVHVEHLGCGDRCDVEDQVAEGSQVWTRATTQGVNLDTGETKFTESYDEFLEFKNEYKEYCRTQSDNC